MTPAEQEAVARALCEDFGQHPDALSGATYEIAGGKSAWLGNPYPQWMDWLPSASAAIRALDAHREAERARAAREREAVAEGGAYRDGGGQ